VGHRRRRLPPLASYAPFLHRMACRAQPQHQAGRRRRRQGQTAAGRRGCLRHTPGRRHPHCAPCSGCRRRRGPARPSCRLHPWHPAR
jgi:hypothetical protein